MVTCPHTFVVFGFCKCGIHPFNRNAIPTQGGGSKISDTEILPEKQGDDCPDDADQIDISAQNDSPIATPTSAHALSSPPQTQQSKFSADKVALFESRYKEGYNIFVDEDYVTWLKLNHLVVLPVDKLSPTLNSVVDAFSDVSLLHSISGPRKFVESAEGAGTIFAPIGYMRIVSWTVLWMKAGKRNYVLIVSHSSFSFFPIKTSFIWSLFSWTEKLPLIITITVRIDVMNFKIIPV